MPKRRILIERLSNGFVRAVLQRRQRMGWKRQTQVVIPPERADKTKPDSTLSMLITTWCTAYQLQFADTIDTRYDYKGVNIWQAMLIELKLIMYAYIFNRRFIAARSKAIFSYLASGVDRCTRGKFYVIQDSKSNPIMINSKSIPELKRKKQVAKNASFLDFDKESLFCAHNLTDEQLQNEPAYKKFYKSKK